MRSIALLFGLLLITGTFNLCTAEEVTLERSLKRLRSDTAKDAATRFVDAKQELAKTYEKQLRRLRLELTTTLDAALEEAKDAKDSIEIQNILDAQSSIQNSESTSLNEVALLKKRLPSSELPSPEMIETQIVGTWVVETKDYSAEWEFTQDHNVLLDNASRGKWQVDQKRSRVLIMWNTENRWDSFHFPFHDGQTSGDSWYAPNVTSAKKIK